MKFARFPLTLFAVSMLIGCAHPRLSRSEAVGIAKRAVESEKSGHLEDYEKPVARYWLIPEKRSWEVFFRSKVQMPGSDFSVIVDDQSGATQVRRGM